ncbi:MAG TPA: protein kinase, partial [Kofleriaceae bacterium]
SPEPIAPDQFGPYEVYERLGLGGMATVCRAKKRGPAGFERSVALKRMLSHLSEDQTFVESFIREAKVSSMLVHPNIAQVYDFGRINGTYYIAMELVPGFDLRKLLRYANRANESIPLPVVLSILGEMCDALDYAHNSTDETGQALHIIHRDISPSNVIVSHTGHTKVIDFGIAKANSRQLHTESGQVKGKLGYMSPEAALGMQIGPVSDVFSLGVVAWELVTASPLFSARTDFETMRKIREAEAPPPSLHNPMSPKDLDRLILSALIREPDHRLANASLFRRALDQVAHREGIQIGSRAVAEWIRQFIQPDDFAKISGRIAPIPMGQDQPTSVMRPSQRARLQRTHDDIQLASEIWGEDAGPNSLVNGPDFSVHSPRAEVLPSTTTPMPVVYPSQASQPLPLPAGRPSYPPAQMHAQPHGTPAGYMPDSMQQIMPYAVPRTAQHKRSRLPLILVIALAVIAGVLAIVLLTKKDQPPVIADPGPGSAITPKQPVALPIDAGVAIAEVKPDASVEVATKQVIAATKTPAPHDTKRHPKDKTHHVAEVEPQPQVETKQPEPPPVEPTPQITEPVKTPPPTVPTPVDPKGPTRTPVVAATAVTKVAGELPVLRGDHDGDVLAKMCIDEAGKVTSVKIVRSSPDMPNNLVGALQGWRYRPYVGKEAKPQAVCF